MMRSHAAQHRASMVIAMRSSRHPRAMRWCGRRWDTPIDAADFYDIFTDAIRRRYELSRPDFPAGETTHQLYVAPKGNRPARGITVQLSQSGSRSLVTLIDAPYGLGTVMDVGKISVEAR